MKPLLTFMFCVCTLFSSMLDANTLPKDGSRDIVTDTLIQTGILYSRIGYDANFEKHILIRATSDTYITKGLAFIINDSSNNKILTGQIQFWGEKWQNYWWIIDFSSLIKEGVYFCQILNHENTLLKTAMFKVHENLLWKDTWKTVALKQLDGRIEMRNKNIITHGSEYAEGGGWQDCGSPLREVNSHATMIVGLLDLLEFSENRISAKNKNEIIKQLIIGLDYIAFCQDKAREIGKGSGAIIHEWPRHTNVITGDVAKGALCFARAKYLLSEVQQEKANEYLQRAVQAFKWLDQNGPILHPGGTDYAGVVQPDDGFDPIPYNAPKGFKRPDEWKTRDIVMMMWTAVELSKSGMTEYKEKANFYANLLMERQIPIQNPEGRFYGHFKTYSSADFTEKAWEHHHMGYDAGSTFPHYIIPLIQMVKLWPDHQKASLWDNVIRNFAYGYFLPACYENPFHLLPMGYFKDQGLLIFSGLWHGINGAYGSAAALSLELFTYTNDTRFKKIAIGNLQWIAGLNAGIQENNIYISKSMIYGIGDEYIGSWTKIPGTICNGFESDAQFRFTKSLKETDGPWVFTDEGWITHSGGWLSALSRLNN